MQGERTSGRTIKTEAGVDNGRRVDIFDLQRSVHIFAIIPHAYYITSSPLLYLCKELHAVLKIFNTVATQEWYITSLFVTVFTDITFFRSQFLPFSVSSILCSNTSQLRHFSVPTLLRSYTSQLRHFSVAPFLVSITFSSHQSFLFVTSRLSHFFVPTSFRSKPWFQNSCLQWRSFLLSTLYITWAQLTD